MKIAWKIVLTGAALLVGVSLAQAKVEPKGPAGAGGFGPGCMEGDGPPPAGSRMMKKLSHDLGLNSEQSAQVRTIMEKNREQLKPLLEQMRSERDALHALIHADTVDESAIRAQAAKVAAPQAELAVNRARMVQQLRAILTPEQLQKFKSLSDKPRPHRGDRHGRKAPRMEQRP